MSKSNLFYRADQEKAKGEKNKENKKRKQIFESLLSIIDENFKHQNLSLSTGTLQSNSLYFEVTFGVVKYDSFMSDAKLYVVHISNRQIICTIVGEKTLKFSITDEHLKTFKTDFEKISFSDFAKTLPPKVEVEPTNPAQIETATPDENVAPPETQTNLNLTEMTIKTTNTELPEFLVNVKEHLFRKNVLHGKHYKSIRVDDQRGCIEIKACNTSTAPDVENALKGFCEVTTPKGRTKDTTFRLWAPDSDNNNADQAVETSQTILLDKRTKSSRGRKPAEPPTEEQLKELNDLLVKVKEAVKLEGYKRGKDFSTILMNTVQQVIVIQCNTEQASEKIKASLKSRQFLSDSSTAKALWVKGILKEKVAEVPGPLFPIHEDSDLSEKMEALKGLMHKLPGILDQCVLLQKENSELKEKLAVAEAKNAGIGAKEFLMMGLLIYDSLLQCPEDAESEILIRWKVEKREVTSKLTRESFLDSFYPVFIEDQK